MTIKDSQPRPVSFAQILVVAVVVTACHVSVVCYAAWRRSAHQIDPTSTQLTQQVSLEVLRTQP
jgi:hypothetical protein